MLILKGLRITISFAHTDERKLFARNDECLKAETKGDDRRVVQCVTMLHDRGEIGVELKKYSHRNVEVVILHVHGYQAKLTVWIISEPYNCISFLEGRPI